MIYVFDYLYYDMYMNRRKFIALGSSATILSIAGCIEDNENQLNTLNLDIHNQKNISTTVHFALESESNISSWYNFSLNSDEKDNFVIELDNPSSEWDNYHIIAGEHHSEGSLLGQAGEQECIKLNFRIEDETINGTFVTNQSECEFKEDTDDEE